MKNSVAVCRDSLPMVRSRWADFVELTRPRLAVMVLFTTAAGFCLAGAGAGDLVRLLHTVLGTALVVAGATSLNQVLERNSDARMERTRNRPLSAGRVHPGEVILSHPVSDSSAPGTEGVARLFARVAGANASRMDSHNMGRSTVSLASSIISIDFPQLEKRMANAQKAVAYGIHFRQRTQRCNSE
jgi:UbiA prenyltransferase family protein